MSEGRFSHDDEMRLLTTPMPDDGTAVRELKKILSWRNEDQPKKTEPDQESNP